MSEIRGFQVEAGMYVLRDDVVASIREYAQSLEDPNAGALIHELASWLSGDEASLDMEETTQDFVDEVAFAQSAASHFVHGAEEDDITLDVARIEIFPDPPDDPRPKWYARSVDTGGYIMKTTGGSFDFEWVVKNAEERWPGISLHLLQNAGEDSKWVEDRERGAFPSVGPPVRRLWAGVTGT
jgi:hypothetical protein